MADLTRAISKMDQRRPQPRGGRSVTTAPSGAGHASGRDREQSGRALSLSLAAIPVLAPDEEGRPLNDADRAFIEAAFRADLGSVIIHTGDSAAAAERADANAYAVGQDIVTRQAETEARSCGLRPGQLPLVESAQQLSTLAASVSRGLAQRRGGDGSLSNDRRTCNDVRLRPSRIGLGGPATVAPASVQQVISASGAPLPPTVRADAERRFGRSFAAVRVHTDSQAAASAAAVHARAYTVGPHIAFATGEYRPDTERGRRLLAHELTHVAQQPVLAPSSFEADSPPQLGPANSALEREADDISRQMLLTEDLPGYGVGSQPAAKRAEGQVSREHVDSLTMAEPGTCVARRQALPTTTEPVDTAKSAPPPSFSAGGKVWFKTKELESSHGPAGPFDVFVTVVFEGEAEIAPAEGEAEGSAVKEPAAEGTGSEGGWEFRGGTTHSLASVKDQGAKAELERMLATQWPGWLEELRPGAVKVEGELTGEGGELSFGAKWGDKPVNYELKLTLIGGKWKEPEADEGRGRLRVLDVGLSRNQEASFEWRLGGALVKVTVKAVVTVHAEPDWKKISIWLAEQGITATAASVATGVVLAYVAWIGYGFYQMDRAVMSGRTRMLGVNFVEGYAEELAAATEETPRRGAVELALLDLDWQSYFNETMTDYLADRIWFDDATSRAKRAGRACILRRIGEVVAKSGVDGWRQIASQHRSRYGIGQGPRTGMYFSAMFQQVQQGKPAGIDLSIS